MVTFEMPGKEIMHLAFNELGTHIISVSKIREGSRSDKVVLGVWNVEEMRSLAEKGEMMVPMCEHTMGNIVSKVHCLKVKSGINQ